MIIRTAEPFELLHKTARRLPKRIRPAFAIGLSLTSKAFLREKYGVDVKAVLGVSIVYDERIPDYDIVLLQLGDYEECLDGVLHVHNGECLDVHLGPWWKGLVVDP